MTTALLFIDVQESFRDRPYWSDRELPAYVPEATLTFDMKHLDGSLLKSSDIVARTTAVLTGRFATICSVEQALERAQQR